ncbi:helix-turn-helix transcriptional regulator [Herbaspirillum sp. VT-16-41]|uniref:helix-turn-helix domain-containing protein n=1 Tax=Herbaspirillum sp. VT-16-41 TaxID=1953765 RepID=UPI00098098D6
MTPFADYLFQLRRARGLRQHEVAARLGLGAAYISALEAARKEPPSPAQCSCPRNSGHSDIVKLLMLQPV